MLPTNERIRPIEVGRSPTRSRRNVPSSSRTTRGAGRKGSSFSPTATGPAPGPPPPCGVENVLCVLMCITSKPASPGLNRPRIAFRFAPSMYASAPAAWTASSSSPTRDSNRPIVDGLVIMIAAVCGPSAARKASRSTPPSGAALIETVLRPAIVAVAGFVPCAESGTSTSVRPVSPREAW